MPPPVLFGCVGGFLGAGKTTALAAAARDLIRRGLTVGVVANDQGHDIVDTAVFRGAGFPTAEVAGGCFCCRFDDLLAGADRLLAEQPVDVLLAEAVGSCTDLVATVYRPLRRFFPDRFRLAPFSVLVEPNRIREMFDGSPAIPTDVGYLFERQLAEADLLVLTKVDTLDASSRFEARRALEAMARTAPVLDMSATGGEGVGQWVDRLLGHDALADRALEIDYDAYARGESALAWLNATVDFHLATGLGVRSVGEALLGEIAARLRHAGLYVPHLKVLVATSQGSARLALTRADLPPAWSGPDLPAEIEVSALVNARAVTDPATLRALVEDAAGAAGGRLGAAARIGRLECFSPPRPVPRHRFAGASMGGS